MAVGVWARDRREKRRQTIGGTVNAGFEPVRDAFVENFAQRGELGGAVCVVVAGIAAYLSVRFLMRYFQTRTLTPFAIYCLAFGAASIFRFA
jgi:undecaprenyl pyrophosphate phosphatase UppP